MTTDERIDRLTTAVESLPASVIARDDQTDAHTRQIEGLINVVSALTVADKAQAERMNAVDRRLESLLESTANLERQWQAYLRSLPRN